MSKKTRVRNRYDRILADLLSSKISPGIRVTAAGETDLDGFTVDLTRGDPAHAVRQLRVLAPEDCLVAVRFEGSEGVLDFVCSRGEAFGLHLEMPNGEPIDGPLDHLSHEEVVRYLGFFLDQDQMPPNPPPSRP